MRTRVLLTCLAVLGVLAGIAAWSMATERPGDGPADSDQIALPHGELVFGQPVPEPVADQNVDQMLGQRQFHRPSEVLGHLPEQRYPGRVGLSKQSAQPSLADFSDRDRDAVAAMLRDLSGKNPYFLLPGSRAVTILLVCRVQFVRKGVGGVKCRSRHQPGARQLFSDSVLSERLAFRGGTALHKLFLRPPARYSEDIDLVQISPAPIGEDLNRIRSILGKWLEEGRWKQTDGGVTLNWRYDSEAEPSRPMRLKVEINTREHGARLGYHFEELVVASRWFTGRARIRSFQLNELMGTKLRALHQRRKSRDLFDLDRALDDPRTSPAAIAAVCVDCMADGGTPITRMAMEANLSAKRSHPQFRSDLSPLLGPGITFDVHRALDRVTAELVSLLPGD